MSVVYGAMAACDYCNRIFPGSPAICCDKREYLLDLMRENGWQDLEVGITTLCRCPDCIKRLGELE